MAGRQGAILISVIAFLCACSQVLAEGGTFANPTVHNVSSFGDDPLTVRRTIFSYSNGAEEIVGTKTGVTFTLNSPVKDVWPKFQDFTSWQKDSGYGFTGPFGNREGVIEYLTDNRSEATVDSTQAFIVEHIIPEQLIVLEVPAWETVDKNGKRAGYRHEGIHSFILNEVDGKTIVMGAMEHSYIYYGADRKNIALQDIKKRVSKIEARVAAGKQDIWETAFFPQLQKLTEGK